MHIEEAETSKDGIVVVNNGTVVAETGIMVTVTGTGIGIGIETEIGIEIVAKAGTETETGIEIVAIQIPSETEDPEMITIDTEVPETDMGI